jgi:hypothetical protein
MPDAQFQMLLRMIKQLGLEVQELSRGVNDKFDTISSSLKSCQSHCHVANPPGGDST